MIDVTPTLSAIQSVVEAVLPGVALYWERALVPDPPPAEFVVLEEGTTVVWQSWMTNTHAQHAVQVLTAARTKGRAGQMKELIFAALSPAEYAVLAGQGAGRIGAHYIAAFRVQTHASI